MKGVEMDTYLTVCFWMHIVAIVIRLMTLSTAEYPRTSKHTLGADVAVLLLSSGFFLWIIYLKWWVVI